jgi:hypothetical protein
MKRTRLPTEVELDFIYELELQKAYIEGFIRGAQFRIKELNEEATEIVREVHKCFV